MFISILTSVVLALLFVGFVLGFVRGWKKSLIRTSLVLASLLIAIFVAPVLASSITEKFVQGATFVGFGLNVDFEKVVADLVGDSVFANDLFSATGTTTSLATALLNVVLNVVTFLILFFSIFILSLIVYWIVVLVLHIKRKKDGEAPIKTMSYWWLKVLGGGIGLVSSLLLCFVLLTPVFGVMNVCDKFLKTTESSSSASAVNVNSYVCGGLYYTEDETIGDVEGYIQKYAEIKKSYDKSFIGGFFNVTGVSSLGESTFNHLTNVSANGLELNVTNELVALIKTYNIYKENFVQGKFDLANNDSLDGVLQIYELADDSKIVKSYIEEFVPKFCERWLAGEKFLGISNPVKGEFEPLVREVLQVFNTTNSTRIKTNINAVVGAIKVANNNDVILNVREGKDLIEILSNNQTFVKEEVLQLTSTTELKYATPKILQTFIEIAYDKIVGGEVDFDDIQLTNQQIDAINWNVESALMQSLSNNVLEVYDAVNGSTDSSAMADQLTNVGEAIDDARASIVLSKHFQVFIEGFISSDKIKLNENVKASILKPIALKNADGTENADCKWNDEDYSFAVTFGAIGEAAKVAQSIVQGSGSVNLDSLSGLIKDAIGNENVKDTINNILENDAVKDMLGTDNSVQVVTDLLDGFVNNTATNEDVDKAIVAGQEIVNLVNNSKNGGELKLSGETETEKIASANKIVENIASSEVVMDLIDAQNSSLAGVSSDLGGDSDILKSAIDTNTNLTTEQKTILNKLFA